MGEESHHPRLPRQEHHQVLNLPVVVLRDLHPLVREPGQETEKGQLAPVLRPVVLFGPGQTLPDRRHAVLVLDPLLGDPDSFPGERSRFEEFPDRRVLVVSREVEPVFQAPYPLVSSQKNRAKSSFLKDFSPLCCRPLSKRGELHPEFCAAHVREDCRPLSKRRELHPEFRAARVREDCRPLSKRGELHLTELGAPFVARLSPPLKARGTASARGMRGNYNAVVTLF